MEVSFLPAEMDVCCWLVVGWIWVTGCFHGAFLLWPQWRRPIWEQWLVLWMHAFPVVPISVTRDIAGQLMSSTQGTMGSVGIVCIRVVLCCVMLSHVMHCLCCVVLFALFSVGVLHFVVCCCGLTLLLYFAGVESRRLVVESVVGDSNGEFCILSCFVPPPFWLGPRYAPPLLLYALHRNNCGLCSIHELSRHCLVSPSFSNSRLATKGTLTVWHPLF